MGRTRGRSFSPRSLACLLVLGLLAQCSRPGDLLRGLEPDGSGLRWSLSVGLLFDRDQMPVDVLAYRDGVADAERLLRLPGLGFRLIADQPMEAQFTMGRTRASRRDPQPERLGLAPSAQNRAIWERSGRPAGLLEALAAAARRRSANGRPLVYDKLPASDVAWGRFVRNQVRYDIVLHNAFAFPDNPRALPEDWSAAEGVRSRLLPASGRRGMERWAGLRSLFRPDGSAPTRSAVREAVVEAVLQLGLPAGRARARERRLALESGRPIMEDCVVCGRLWSQRLAYLRARMLLRKRHDAEACAAMQKFAVPPAFKALGVQAPHAASLRAQWLEAAGYCAKRK